MERMGDILAKVAGRRASIQSKTRRTTSVRKTSGASSVQKAPPASAQPERQTQAPQAPTPAQTKTSVRPSVQALAPARPPQPVRRPDTSTAPNAHAMPDAIESPTSLARPKGTARVAPDAEPILEMPTRRRTTAATPASPSASPDAAVGSAYAAEYAAGASLRLKSAALRASVPPISSAPQATTRHNAELAPGAPARPAARAPQLAPAQPSEQISETIGSASAASAARTRSNERPPAAGMLPLGAAAQGYLAAVGARRQQSPQAAQEQDAAETLRPNAQQRTTSRKSAQLAAASEQSMVYGAPEEDVCPICGGMGYVRMDVPVGDPMFGQAAPCECKERMREERRRSDLRRISSLDAFDKKTFETFDYRAAPAARDALEIAHRYADDPQGWLILSGGYGVGKTHLAAAIANYQLSRGAHVFFSIVPDLLDHLRAAFAPSSESPFDEMFDRVREAGLLVLDDLGAENSTAWATEKLFQLINYRYNYRMPTVITTNHRLLSHIDERINSRLSDLSLARHVAIDAPDYRQRHTGRAAPTRGRSGPRG